MLDVFCAGQNADWESWDVVGIETYAVLLDENVDDAVAFYFHKRVVVAEGNILGFARRFIVCDGVEQGWMIGKIFHAAGVE